MANSPLQKYRPIYLVTHTKADTTEQGISSRFIDISTTLIATIIATSTISATASILDVIAISAAIDGTAALSATATIADYQLSIWESTDTIAWESGDLLIWETLT